MTAPFVGEIRMFGGNFAPISWAFCAGQLLPISQYEVLFTLIGTTYGGDGVTTFGIPDLRGRVPLNQGQGPGLTNRVIGQMSGSEGVTLTSSQMPTHTHTLFASTAKGDQPVPIANSSIMAQPDAGNPNSTATYYVLPTPNPLVAGPLAATSVTPQGGSLPHNNLMPLLVLNYIISLQGIFPSSN